MGLVIAACKAILIVLYFMHARHSTKFTWAITTAGLSYALQRIAQRKFDSALWMVCAAESENIPARIRERGLERPDDSIIVGMQYHRFPGYEEGRLEKYVTLIDDLHREVRFLITYGQALIKFRTRHKPHP